MDTGLPKRIVRVEATFSEDRRKHGTGLRLKPGWILTSQHVLEHREDGAIEEARKIEVVLAKPGDGEAPRAPAEVAWRGEENLDPEALRALDAALLTEEDLPACDGEEIRLVPLHLPSGPCETAGWVQRSLLSKDLVHPEEFSGRFSAIDRDATLLPLRFEGLEPKSTGPEAAPYAGVSGAPVFVAGGRFDGWLYGLVRKGPRNRPDQLYAVSVPALLRDAAFRRLLGVQDPPPPHESLILETRKLLTGEPDLAARLARSDSDWRAAWEAQEKDGGVDGLIAELCERGDLKRLLGALEVLATEGERRDRVESLRRWAGHLTGLLAHQFMAREGRRVERQGGGRVAVPLGSPGYAEAVLAADHGEAPRYELRDGAQKPRLQVPASRIEAGILDSRRAQDQLENLADSLLRDNLATPRYLSEAELDIIAGADVQDLFEVRLEAMRLALEDFRHREKTRRRPFLLVTPKLRKNDFHGTLQAFLDYMADLLPQLEQVELTGKPAESLRLEHQLKPLWRILGIDKGDGG